MKYYSVNQVLVEPFSFSTSERRIPAWADKQVRQVDLIRMSDLAEWSKMQSEAAVALLRKNVDLFDQAERLNLLMKISGGAIPGVLSQLWTREDGRAWLTDRVFRRVNPNCSESELPSMCLTLDEFTDLTSTIWVRSGLMDPPGEAGSDVVKAEISRMIGTILPPTQS